MAFRTFTAPSFRTLSFPQEILHPLNDQPPPPRSPCRPLPCKATHSRVPGVHVGGVTRGVGVCDGLLPMCAMLRPRLLSPAPALDSCPLKNEAPARCRPSPRLFVCWRTPAGPTRGHRTAVATGTHAHAFISCGSIPGVGMAGARDNYMFNFQRTHSILFHLYRNFVSWHFSPF